MPLFNGIRVELDFEYVLHRLRIDEAQSKRNRLYVEALRAGIPVVAEKSLPTIYYKRYALSWASVNAIRADGALLQVGDVVQKQLDGASSFFIGIATIGHAVEEVVHEPGELLLHVVDVPPGEEVLHLAVAWGSGS